MIEFTIGIAITLAFQFTLLGFFIGWTIHSLIYTRKRP